MNPINYVYLATILFSIGAATVILRRNAIVAFMGVELMLNAANLAIVAFARKWGAFDVDAQISGHVYAFLVMVVAAAEVVVGLAIIIAIFRTRRSINIDEPAELRG